MTDPLGDAARRRLTDAAARELVDDGYEVTLPPSSAEPPAVAKRGGEHVSVEPLAAEDVDPTTIASRLGHAMERGRRALFVVETPAVERRLRDLLAAPTLLVAERDGRRTFHAGPDRIPIDRGGYACVHVDGMSDPRIRWRETDTPLGPVPTTSGVDPAGVDDAGRPVVPRLICEVNDEVVAVLAGVESLRVPPATAFPYGYARNATDKRFRVRRGEDGAVADDFSGFTAMREAGYVPIPMPLVPEHVLGEAVDVEDRWTIIRPDVAD